MQESNTQTNNPLEATPDPEPEPLSVDVAINHPLDVSHSTINEIVRAILSDHDWRYGEISVAVVDDQTIHELNRQYLDHDYETDVLSFVLDADSDSRHLNGEIVVSADTAASCAEVHGIGVLDELLLYIIHGTLHLAGLDDKSEEGRRQMRDAEYRYTRRFEIEYSPPSEPDEDGDSD